MAIYNRQKQGTIQPGDLTSGATALRILFAYMQEQGVNGKLSVAIQRPTIVSGTPTASLAQELYDELQVDGVSSITLGQISQSLSVSKKNYAAISKTIRTQGVAKIESDMVMGFLMLSRTNGNGAIISALGHRANGIAPASYLLPVVAEPLTADQCAELARLSAESTALALVAAISGAEPVALAFEAAALAYDAEASAGGCD